MKKWGVLIGTGIASMLTTIDFTIVNTSLIPIQKSLSASLSELQWFIAAFGIPYCVLLVICGRLADLIGRRLVFYIGIGGFGIASLSAGLSTTSWELILSRFFQGAFAATIFPCAMGLTTDVFPKNEQKKALGIYFGMSGLGLALGPAVGGFITSSFNWHWIFFINIPFVVLSYLICIPSVSESKLVEKEKIDWKGLFLLLFGLSALVTWINEGQNLGWLSSLSFTLLASACVFLGFYYRHEKVCPSPILPFRFFRNRGFLLGISNYFACNSCMWAILFLVPLYLQGLLGYSAAHTGTLLLIMTAVSIALPTIAGHFLTKKGARSVLFAIFTLLFLGYFAFLLFSWHETLWVLIFAFLLMGFGWGSGRGIGGLLVLSEYTSNAYTGMIVGAASTLFNLAGVLLMTISGAILRFSEKVRFIEMADRANIHLTKVQEKALRNLGDPENARDSLSNFNNFTIDQILTLFRESFQFGFRVSILFLVVFTAILFLFVLKVLNKKSKVIV